MKRVLFVILPLLSFIGCSYPTFINPVVDPAKAERFDELFGAYRSDDAENGKVVWLHIGKCKSEMPVGYHKVALVGTDSENAEQQVAEFIVCF